MAERPLLILPAPGPRARTKRNPRILNLHIPEPGRQAQRLQPQFKAFREALDKRRARLQLADPGIVPEEVAVFDIRGTVKDFLKAVEKVPSLEWMGDVETDDVPADEDFYAEDRVGAKQPHRTIGRRLFLVFSNHQAQEQLMSLFRRHEKGQGLPEGLGPWSSVFRQLHTVRPWNAGDRLSDSGLPQALEGIPTDEDAVVPCEIELWFRRNEVWRTTAEQRVRDLVHREGGRVRAGSVIKEIRYHALAAELPASTVRRIVPDYSGDIELVECEQVQYLRAAGQMSVFVAEANPPRHRIAKTMAEPGGSPVVAVLDGAPLAGHEQLRNRLIVDDPDGFGQGYPAARRRHGTAMASLVVHGDLAGSGSPVSRPIYLRPILRPDPNDPYARTECIPSGTLAPDLIHRAVRRMFEGEGGEPPAAPRTAVVNLSIGLRNRMFGHSLSPLARLLDWLAWKYKVLFVVSAGNHALPPAGASSGTSVSDFLLPEDHRRISFLRALAADTHNRRLLSPAESVNALTVGAEHADLSSATPLPGWTDPYLPPGPSNSRLASLISAHGMGYRRAIKPDLLFPGGRITVKETVPGSGTLETYVGSLPPGQEVAAPGPQPGDLRAIVNSRGTSNAAALASREAAILRDLLDDLRKEPGGSVLDSMPPSVSIKALLAHGADWGGARKLLRAAFEKTPYRKKFREFASRLIGYGVAKVDRARECAPERVVALGGGELRNGESHIHLLPVPKIFNEAGLRKRLTITLAWLTPVNPMHQAWRRAHLWFEIAAPAKLAEKMKRRDADARSVQRGTLQHEVMEGKAAIPTPDGIVKVKVNCREDAGQLEDTVPYALAMTLEVATPLGVDIYAEVRAAIEAIRVRIPAKG